MRRIINNDTRLLDEIVYVLSVEFLACHREYDDYGQVDRPDCSG
jgi:hypothetical protein